MRSTQNKSGFSHICDSEMGGGQGNALTGLIFVITIDRVLKDTEAHYPGMRVKAIHDDITLIGPPEKTFGDDNAMAFLEMGLNSLSTEKSARSWAPHLTHAKTNQVG
jgi:hypothetical protein